MRFAFVFLFLALLSGPARADRTINTVIGDVSWAGRTDPGDEVTRIRAHLAFVHALLSARDVSALSASQRDARITSLAHLARYIDRGEFPRRTDDAYPGRHPRFIDDRGVHCAVGQLIADSGHAALARAINADFEYAHVVDIDSPALLAWASDHGFTVEELAMIQPGYSSPPTEDSVRTMIVDAKDELSLMCAQKHAAMKNLLVIAQTDGNGGINVSTHSTDPFAKCFVAAASRMDRGGHAFDGPIRIFSIGVDLSFTPPQKLLETKIAGWSPSCSPHTGPLSREADVQVTSTREGLVVRATSIPANPLVDACLAENAKYYFANFEAGVWTLHATKRIKMNPHVYVDVELLKHYASEDATTCLPKPARGQKTTVRVTAKPDDPQFTVRASGSATFATCMRDALTKRFAQMFRAHYVDRGKPVEFFRIDTEVDVSATIAIESAADRTKRLEEAKRRFRQDREPHY